MKMTIKNAVVLIEFDNKEVHQAVIKTETLKKFLEAVATQEGSLRVIEEPITGLILESSRAIAN